MKTIPPATPGNVTPPNRDYKYFENCKEHPFRFASRQFQLVNAWWLADAALLAYADEEFCQLRLKDAGFSGFKFFKGSGTQCYVAWNEDFVFVAFRGTQVFKLGEPFDLSGVMKDVSVDAAIALVDSAQGGFVHQGFRDALDAVWVKEGLLMFLTELKRQSPARTIWFSGHSLGAALATLAADRFGLVDGLYTFGSPRVGDETFVRDFFVNTYRFVNNNDIVTRVPSSGPYSPWRLLPGVYRHVGQLKYIDSAHHISDSPSVWERIKDDFRGSFGALINAAGSLRGGWRFAIPADHLNDHGPLYYALHIWNNYERDR